MWCGRRRWVRAGLLAAGLAAVAGGAALAHRELPVPTATFRPWHFGQAGGERGCADWAATPGCLMDALVACRVLGEAGRCAALGMEDLPRRAGLRAPWTGPWTGLCHRLRGTWEFFEWDLPYTEATNPYGLEAGDVAFTLEILPERLGRCDLSAPTTLLSALMRHRDGAWYLRRHGEDIDYVLVAQDSPR